MARNKKSKNPNHPKEGSSTRVEPIRDQKAIQHIKDQLQDRPRDLCIFILGINTAFRANELLSLSVGQVINAKAGDSLPLKQSKTKKYRTVYLNPTCISSIQNWLQHHPDLTRKNPLFPSRKRNKETGRMQPIQVSSLSRMVKDWCEPTTLTGNYASHSLRKTWGYHQRIMNNTPLPLLMRAFGHKSEAQTMNYLGIENEEIKRLYEMEL